MTPSSHPSTLHPTPPTNDRRALRGGLLLLAGLVVMFLAEPMLRYPSAHYCFADFVQSFGPINVEPGHRPENPFMGDPAVIYHPWTIFNRAEVRAGRFPVWNPYNGGGVPHLANYQSGVLSPYNLPFYLLDFKTGLLASAFLKLLAIAAFTFLFLRACGLRQEAALFGATAFTFAGYHVAWVSGAITATAATLPASLFFTEVALRRAEAARGESAPPRLTPPLAGLTLSLAVGLVAGHPENLYMGGLVLTAYLGFRLWQLRSSLGTGGVAGLVARFAACAVVAVLLAGLQLLPFLEYMLHSEVITGRSGLSAGLASRPAHLLPLLLTPHVLGRGTGPFFMVPGSPVPFPEAIAPYAGATVLFLAILSAFLLRASAHVRFFFVLMALWLVYTLNPLGAAVVFRAIPGLAELPINRSHDAWLLAVCCAAAWLVDALVARRPGAPSAPVLAGSGLGTLAMGLLASRWLIDRYREPIEAAAPASREVLRFEIAFFIVTFLLGVAAAVALRSAGGAPARRAGAAVLIAVAFIQTGFLLRSFNPTIDDRLVYPMTEEMERLRRIVGRDTLIVAGGRSASLVADTNMLYALSLPNNYDGIWIRRYDRLYRGRFGPGSFPRTPLRFDPRGLDLFGVDYVLGNGPLINTELADRRGLHLRPEPLATGSRPAVQTFVAAENRLQALAVYATCSAPGAAGTVILRLQAVPGHEELAARTVSCESLDRRDPWVTLSFPAVEGSAGQRFRLIARAVGGSGEDGVVLYSWSGVDYPPGALTVAGARRDGTLAFDFAYDLDSFDRLAAVADRTLYRYRGGRSRYYTVGEAVFVEDEEEAKQRVQAPGHDPTRVVVLSDPPVFLGPEERNRDPGRVEIVAEQATRVELVVTRSEPGYLVIARPHYPGWHASVDGEAQPLLRANYAFMAVEVPAGTRRVVLEYAPSSVRWGAASTLASLVLGGAWVGWGVRRRPR